MKNEGPRNNRFSFQQILLLFSLVLMVLGIVMIVTGIGGASPTKVTIGVIQIETSSAGIFILVVGFVLVILLMFPEVLDPVRRVIGFQPRQEPDPGDSRQSGLTIKPRTQPEQERLDQINSVIAEFDKSFQHGSKEDFIGETYEQIAAQRGATSRNDEQRQGDIQISDREERRIKDMLADIYSDYDEHRQLRESGRTQKVEDVKKRINAQIEAIYDEFPRE